MFSWKVRQIPDLVGQECCRNRSGELFPILRRVRGGNRAGQQYKNAAGCPGRRNDTSGTAI
jgi:hypothetical protein